MLHPLKIIFIFLFLSFPLNLAAQDIINPILQPTVLSVCKDSCCTAAFKSSTSPVDLYKTVDSTVPIRQLKVGTKARFVRGELHDIPVEAVALNDLPFDANPVLEGGSRFRILRCDKSGAEIIYKNYPPLHANINCPFSVLPASGIANYGYNVLKGEMNTYPVEAEVTPGGGLLIDAPGWVIKKGEHFYKLGGCAEGFCDSFYHGWEGLVGLTGDEEDFKRVKEYVGPRNSGFGNEMDEYYRVMIELDNGETGWIDSPESFTETACCNIPMGEPDGSQIHDCEEFEAQLKNGSSAPTNSPALAP